MKILTKDKINQIIELADSAPAHLQESIVFNELKDYIIEGMDVSPLISYLSSEKFSSLPGLTKGVIIQNKVKFLPLIYNENVGNLSIILDKGIREAIPVITTFPINVAKFSEIKDIVSEIPESILPSIVNSNMYVLKKDFDAYQSFIQNNIKLLDFNKFSEVEFGNKFMNSTRVEVLKNNTNSLNIKTILNFTIMGNNNPKYIEKVLEIGECVSNEVWTNNDLIEDAMSFYSYENAKAVLSWLYKKNKTALTYQVLKTFRQYFNEDISSDDYLPKEIELLMKEMNV